MTWHTTSESREFEASIESMCRHPDRFRFRFRVRNCQGRPTKIRLFYETPSGVVVAVGPIEIVEIDAARESVVENFIDLADAMDRGSPQKGVVPADGNALMVYEDGDYHVDWLDPVEHSRIGIVAGPPGG